MDADLLDPPIAPMPGFAPGEWLNIDHPLTTTHLRGRVVMIDFWDYTCLACLRAIPSLIAWHEHYQGMDFVVVGVHTPEFRFARTRALVERAAADLGIWYPVLLDNERRTWEQFAVRAWPTRVLVDPDGYVRHRAEGVTTFRESERALRRLLHEHDPEVALPRLMDPLHPKDEPGADRYRATPDLYVGYERGALGNPMGYAASSPMVYELPREYARREPYFYAGGIWRAGLESFAFAGQDGGQIALPYTAYGVSAVLSPSADPVEVALNLRRTDAPPRVDVLQDGAPLTPENAGRDVLYDDGGVSYLMVERPRLYELVRNPAFGSHELELTVRAHGLAFYSFTFTSSVVAG
jgi:thiol-disulfide isomerase/thioredoxin